MAEAKDILDKVKSLKSKSESFSMKRNKGTVTGSLIGAAGGLLIGFTRNYNLITSGILGAIVGGLAAHLLLPQDND